MAKLADAPDLGSGSARSVGSSPSPSIFEEIKLLLLSERDLDETGGQRLGGLIEVGEGFLQSGG